MRGVGGVLQDPNPEKCRNFDEKAVGVGKTQKAVRKHKKPLGNPKSQRAEFVFSGNEYSPNNEHEHEQLGVRVRVRFFLRWGLVVRCSVRFFGGGAWLFVVRFVFEITYI